MPTNISIPMKAIISDLLVTCQGRAWGALLRVTCHVTITVTITTRSQNSSVKYLLRTVSADEDYHLGDVGPIRHIIDSL